MTTCDTWPSLSRTTSKTTTCDTWPSLSRTTWKMTTCDTWPSLSRTTWKTTTCDTWPSLSRCTRTVATCDDTSPNSWPSSSMPRGPPRERLTARGDAVRPVDGSSNASCTLDACTPLRTARKRSWALRASVRGHGAWRHARLSEPKGEICNQARSDRPRVVLSQNHRDARCMPRMRNGLWARDHFALGNSGCRVE